jgi:3-oxoacyl-[acyl-carrier-protein] synthase-1
MQLRPSLAVTAAGLVTSVGRSRAQACAAIRAGISHPMATGEIAVADDDTMELVPLPGHPVPAVTEGFFRQGRWLRLAVECLADLSATRGRSAPALLQESRCHVIVVTRPMTPELVGVDDGTPAPEVLHRLTRQLHAGLVAELRTPIRAEGFTVLAAGHAGLAWGVTQAATWLGGGTCDAVLLLAVDSWFDPVLLGDAMEAGNLKIEGAATGLSPGEAAVALVLEPGARAKAQQHEVLGSLSAVATAVPAAANPAEPIGIAVVECIEQVIAQAGVPGFAGDVFLDLTGEEWRALAWGHALVRLHDKLGAIRVHTPAGSVGDVGAASGALGVCLAIESQRRRWASSPLSLVVSTSSTGQAGCLAVAGELA